jgi:hypothetical protein
MIIKSWNEIGSDCIKNTFRHIGFQEYQPDEEELEMFDDVIV